MVPMTPMASEAMLFALGNMMPPKNSLDRLPKGLSARWEVIREVTCNVRSCAHVANT